MSFNFFFPTDRPTGNHSNRKKIFESIINFILFFIFDRPTALKRLEKNPPSVKSTEHGLIIVLSICHYYIIH